MSTDNSKPYLLTDTVKDFWNTGIGKLSEAFTVPVAANNFHAKEKTEQEKIVFVLSLSGRFSTFMRFLNNYEEVIYSLSFKFQAEPLTKIYYLFTDMP